MPCETGALCEAGAGLETGEFWSKRVFGADGSGVVRFSRFVIKSSERGAERLRRGKNALWITDFAGFKPELSTERLFYIWGFSSRGVMNP